MSDTSQGVLDPGISTITLVVRPVSARVEPGGCEDASGGGDDSGHGGVYPFRAEPRPHPRSSTMNEAYSAAGFKRVPDIGARTDEREATPSALPMRPVRRSCCRREL